MDIVQAMDKLPSHFVTGDLNIHLKPPLQIINWAHAAEILEAIEKLIRKLFAENDKRLQEAIKKVKIYKERIHNLTEKEQCLKINYQNLEIEVNNLKSKLKGISSVSKDLQDATEKNKCLKKENEHLRSVILKDVAECNVTDNHVIFKLSELRQILQRIGNCRVLDLRMKTTVNFRSWKGNLIIQDFQPSATNQDLKLLFRAIVYSHIHKCILENHVFDSNNETVATGLQATAQLFSRSNNSNKAPVPPHKLMDWIICTMECLKSSTDDQQGSKLAVTVAWDIYNFVEQFLIANADQQEVNRLQEMITEACQIALELRKMMSFSREGYYVYTIARDTQLDESEVEPMDVFSQGPQSDTVLFTLAGNVGKHATYRAEAPKILEKAEVVLYPASPADAHTGEDGGAL